MKKRIWFILLLISLLEIINLQGTLEKTITGEIITGDAAQNMGMNISIIGAPRINLITPENKTYFSNNSLLLNYSLISADFVWYNLDNSQDISLISSTRFNASEGNHILYLYANNSYGENSKNVTFYINSSRFMVVYNEYTGSSKGASTDFNNIPYEDLYNKSDIVLENSNYGKIIFNEEINLTEDNTPENNILNLDSDTNISYNRIEVNPDTLPNFNKSATLWLYNLTFSNPRILKDGSICLSSVCTKENYSAGILRFNVTGFSIYSAEETLSEEEIPSESLGQPPVSGGGGGIVKEKIKEDFSINKEKIKILVKQGETRKEIFIIKNTGKTKINISIKSPQIENFLKISETEFALEIEESKTIEIDFIAREETIPDLYIGKIEVKSKETKKEIITAIEVISKKPLFDIKLEIPKRFLQIAPGEEILAKISLYNLGEIKRADTTLNYLIKDLEGNILVQGEETLAVETQASLIKTVKIPENAKSGEYMFYARVNYKENIVSASDWFSIGEKPAPKPSFNFFYIILIFILFLILLIILYFLLKKKKKKQEKPGKKQGKNISIIILNRSREY